MSRFALLLLLLATPALADPFASEWAPSAKSRARLIADADGAALEIVLAPGAITYWRDPGEAGVPPTFDFAASENLASVQVNFPPPQRIDEPDGSVAFGYRAGVILPLVAVARDPAKPVKLVAKVDYGVCEKICLPARAALSVTLPAGPSPFEERLAQARARIPAIVAPESEGVEVTGAGDNWRLCLTTAPDALYIEAPEGYWIEPKVAGRCAALHIAQTPEGGKPPIGLRVTVVRAGGAVELRASLGS